MQSGKKYLNYASSGQMGRKKKNTVYADLVTQILNNLN